MTDTTTDLSESIRIARELERAKSDERVAAVERVANAAHVAVAIDAEYKRALADFEAEWGSKTRSAVAEHERAWNAALGAGWSAKELRQAQVPEPGRAAPRSRRRTSAKRGTEAMEQHSEE
ncbi:hypothetical protein [Agromyces sp. GXQ0307]|uniref:hypothetical protein n=1 Tax=Agromyces sp. GXQ0307 TaxID=3377835 RepID=UPI003839D376